MQPGQRGRRGVLRQAQERVILRAGLGGGVGYEEFRERLAAYLTHYNETRIKKSLDWMSPVQYRRSLGLAA